MISTRQVERGEGSHDDRAGDGIQRDRLRARARAAGPFVWWLLISWWASGIGVAWAALVMIIGIQVAIWLINRLPTVLTLRPRRQSWTLGQDKFGRSVVIEHRREQVPWPLRGLWFVFVGRWASAVWMGIARLIQLTIIGIPITILMFNRTPFIASLYRY